MEKWWGTCSLVLQGKRFILLVILIGVFSFTGGVVVANEVTLSKVFTNKPISDLEWATARGLLSGSVTGDQKVTQADFLKLLLTVYKPAQQGVIVPHGAENHWAAQYYATAKNEGLINCSCQIKPDENISYQEASKLIYRAINRKAGSEQVKLEDVQAWGKHTGDVMAPATYTEVSSLLHKMDDMVEESQLKRGGK